MRFGPVVGSLLLWFAADATAHDVIVPASPTEQSAEQLTERIYVIHGPQKLPSADTGGFMNNPGFIVTAKGVVVVDPGSRLEVGVGVLDEISAIASQPVLAVLNTHVRGDHWLGNQAVSVCFPQAVICAHQRMIERMRNGEGEYWIDPFRNMTGGAMGTTVVVAPRVGLKGGEVLHFDDTALRILHAGKAHTDHDLMIEVLQDNSMFLGDVATNRRVPSSNVHRMPASRGGLLCSKPCWRAMLNASYPDTTAAADGRYRRRRSVF